MGDENGLIWRVPVVGEYKFRFFFLVKGVASDGCDVIRDRESGSTLAEDIGASMYI